MSERQKLLYQSGVSLVGIFITGVLTFLVTSHNLDKGQAFWKEQQAILREDRNQQQQIMREDRWREQENMRIDRLNAEKIKRFEELVALIDDYELCHTKASIFVGIIQITAGLSAIFPPENTAEICDLFGQLGKEFFGGSIGEKPAYELREARNHLTSRLSLLAVIFTTEEVKTAACKAIDYVNSREPDKFPVDQFLESIKNANKDNGEFDLALFNESMRDVVAGMLDSLSRENQKENDGFAWSVLTSAIVEEVRGQNQK